MGEANGNSKKRSYYKKFLIIKNKAIPVIPFSPIAFSGLSLVGQKTTKQQDRKTKVFQKSNKVFDGFKTRLILIRCQRFVRMRNIKASMT